jgi:hypothetical protein
LAKFDESPLKRYNDPVKNAGLTITADKTMD